MESALDYAKDSHHETGHPLVEIRAGLHVGPVTVKPNDLFGGTVNIAARIVGQIDGAEIWMSDRAKEDLESGGEKRHAHLKWKRWPGVRLKGLEGNFVLWQLLG